MRIWIVGGLALAAAGCVTTPESTSEPRLTGTEWRLIEFISPEDSIGTIRARPDEVYTLRLDPDGSLAAGLTCNRGAGRWSSPDVHKTMGTVTLEVKAVTMAACPPTQFPRLPDDLGRIRSFVIRDGRLHLNLMIDGGDYVWIPQ
jgi:heat shock protein HslJ